MNYWLVDFEFHVREGMPPRPICMVARSLPSRETLRVWLWDSPPVDSPIPIEPSAIYVAYAASAELGCHLALGWALPQQVLDLHSEFRWLTSGRAPYAGHSLSSALLWFGLGGVDVGQKTAMRQLALRGGPFSRDEQLALLSYCEADVTALEMLLPYMLPRIDMPRALIRGRYSPAVARVESVGIPLDMQWLEAIREGWEHIEKRLIAEIDRAYAVYDGVSFRARRWEAWCEMEGIRWPRLPDGSVDLKRETFRQMSKRHPKILPIHELRTSLSQLRPRDLAVGSDGRNRYQVRPFGAKTGRNTPSSSKAIFGPARWIRHLIKPHEGMALAYIDWCQQELGIAACLSGDEVMWRAYKSGDPYLAFARLAGAVPEHATRESHPHEREVYKIGALAVLMGMGPHSLGVATGACDAMGSRLLQQHKAKFPRFWKWSDNEVDRAMLGETLQSVFGWQLHPDIDKPTTFRNFALQANGAEMLRIAAMAITERNLRLCALVHDAVLIEAPVADIDNVVSEVRQCMAAASRAVLGGFELETDACVVRWPDRYHDSRGAALWKTTTSLLGMAGSPASI